MQENVPGEPDPFSLFNNAATDFQPTFTSPSMEENSFGQFGEATEQEGFPSSSSIAFPSSGEFLEPSQSLSSFEIPNNDQNESPSSMDPIETKPTDDSFPSDFPEVQQASEENPMTFPEAADTTSDPFSNFGDFGNDSKSLDYSPSSSFDFGEPESPQSIPGSKTTAEQTTAQSTNSTFDFPVQESQNIQEPSDSFGDFSMTKDATEGEGNDPFGDFGESGGATEDSFGDFGFGDVQASGDQSFSGFSNESGDSSAFGDFGNDGDSGDTSWGFTGSEETMSGLGKVVSDVCGKSDAELDSIINSTMNSVTNGDSLDPFPVLASQGLDSLSKQSLTSGGYWKGTLCSKCESPGLLKSHLCLKCGNSIRMHQKRELFDESKISKQRFIKALRIPVIETSHLNPLQPTAVGETLPSNIIPSKFDPFAQSPIVPLQQASTVSPPLVSTVDFFPTADPPTTTASPALADFDLNLFGEVKTETKKVSKKKPARSDFDNFLLGFESPSPTGAPINTSMASINEKIQKSSKSKSHHDSNTSDFPCDNKKLLEIINKIPDLTFMSSKTLVVPASKYDFNAITSPS